MNNIACFALVKVTPKEGMHVLNPVTMKPLPPEGELVEYLPLWKRRQLEGDVIITLPAEGKGNGKENGNIA